MDTHLNGNGKAPKPIEYRCEYCNRLHFKGYLPAGAYVELLCPRSNCGRLSVYKGDESKAKELFDKSIPIMIR